MILKALVLSLTLSTSAWATDFGRCNVLFPNKKAPEISSSLLNTKRTKPLCFDEFAVLYSLDTKTPVYAIERLSYLFVKVKIKRTNNFHEEPLLALKERSTLKDYARSGYDRGHNANARDMHTDTAMFNSFSLANMSPQAKDFNRHVWAKIEDDVRKYVKRSAGDVYVFTGGYFEPGFKTIGPNKVGVPSYFYKVVYDSQKKKSWVYFLENKEGVKMKPPISYEEFVNKTGIKVLD